MWMRLSAQFETLSRLGESSVMWTFDASARKAQTEWSVLAESKEEERQLEQLFALAGRQLREEGLQQLMFPAKLLAQPSAQERWFAALRHAGLNVERLTRCAYRTENGIIRAAAAASAHLCRKLNSRPRGRAEAQSHFAPPAEVRDLCLTSGVS
jgi:hypothetical protein